MRPRIPRVGPSEEWFRLSGYLLVGVINTGIGFGIFLIINLVLGVGHLIAYGITVLIWTGFGYELQRRLVFKRKPSRSAVVKYFIATFALLPAGGFGMFVGVELLHLSPEVAYLANTLVWTSAMFLYSRFNIFSPSA